MKDIRVPQAATWVAYYVLAAAMIYGFIATHTPGWLIATILLWGLTVMAK